MRISDSRLKTKLTLMAVLSAAAAILCVVIAFVIQDLQLVNRIKSEQTKTHNNVLANHLAIALREPYPILVEQLLKTSISEHGIIAAAVVGPSDRVYASHQFKGIENGQRASPTQLNTLVQAQNNHAPVSVHYTKVPLEGNRYATLVTVVSRSDVQKRIGFMMGYSAMAAVLALLIATAISWFVQKVVSQPIRRLIALSRGVKSTGDYGVRAIVTGRDELGELAQGFNDMLEQIQARDQNLEKQVRQRTRELEELADAFRYRALHDALTGLPNRALLREEFYRAVAHANRSGLSFALMLIDLDDFKAVNDTYGHDVGDELLQQFARRLQDSVRGEDRVCRLGGDEFVALMEGIGSDAMIQTIGENLRVDLDNDLIIRDKPMHITVSIGASLYPKNGKQLTELKRKADIAMYASKAGGKNQLTIYTASVEQGSSALLVAQAQLAKAIGKHEIKVDYQPQVDIEAGSLVAAEALVRWHHPEQGILLPKDFIALAEETGLIQSIDLYVLDCACRQSAEWLRVLGRVIPVSVNLSGVHFRTIELVDTIRATLKAHQLTSEHLIVELTQSVLGEDERTTQDVVAAIQKLKVRVALDNFGVADASLHYMRSFQVDIVKLDKSFSRFVHESERENKLAKGIVEMAKHYGVVLVAEGVESESQAHSLTSLGCHVMQGYWCAKPCENYAFERWLAMFDQNYVA
ncbi:EAL domain-containing protein [Teredinibacter purpureus]|uniref:EAL domain-containing protein n=1 Tax=Teredinibacter purpureus TaxID=2731756 RepID=UPI0005F7701B|nr:EAL domain-containing protein [Teredinibacter purpureus]